MYDACASYLKLGACMCDKNPKSRQSYCSLRLDGWGTFKSNTIPEIFSGVEEIKNCLNSTIEGYLLIAVT